MQTENAEISRRLRSQLGKSHDTTRTLLRIKKARDRLLDDIGASRRGRGGAEEKPLRVETRKETRRARENEGRTGKTRRVEKKCSKNTGETFDGVGGRGEKKTQKEAKLQDVDRQHGLKTASRLGGGWAKGQT